MAKLKVVITDYIEPNLKWEEEQFARLGVDFSYHQLKFGSPHEILAAAFDADILVVNMAKIGADVVDGLSRCKLVIRHGIGYDNVDVHALSRRGITLANIPDYCVVEVAEQAVMLILACQRKLLCQHRILADSATRGEWDFTSVYPVYSLQKKTLGIVGFGRIGRAVYRMMQGFGISFLVTDPYLSEEDRREYGVELHPLETLLRESDIITIHTPLNQETYHLFDDPQFRLMKRSAVLVNTSRGGIVNLWALDRALREGLLAHAGIDVYEEKEPPTPDFPLLHNERAVCTPHLGWLSEEAGWNIREQIVDDVRRFLRGQPPKHQVNREVPIRFQ